MTTSVTDQLEKDLMMMLSSSNFEEFTPTVPSTALEWSNSINSSLQELQLVIGDIDDSSLPTPTRLDPPTLRELVDAEIQAYVRDESKTPRNIEEIEDEYKAANTNGLESTKLSEFFEDEKFSKYFSDLKNHLPMSGTRRPFGLSTAKLTEHSQITGPMGLSATKARPDGLSQSDGGYVTIQLYKNISNRDVKILELEFSISTQMDVVFNTITNHFPNDYMFDGPMYAGSGMIVIRNCMYVVGPEDYSIPYMSWLAGQKDVPDLEVVGMSSVILGNIPDLMNICLANEACFLVFNGDEELRIFFSNFTNASTRPNVVFKRRIPRVTRCVLCTSRAADLVIVDDEMLPRNPSHCCSSCYRRIRSNTDGHFVPPAPNVIVSVYKQV